jgi:hypothetical protein
VPVTSAARVGLPAPNTITSPTAAAHHHVLDRNLIAVPPRLVEGWKREPGVVMDRAANRNARLGCLARANVEVRLDLERTPAVRP